jgi:predicted dehydrogenase
VTPEGRLHAGILGCGRIAGAFAEPGGTPTTHAQALVGAGNGPFRLAAVSDADEGRAQFFAARWNAQSVCAPGELGSAGLDLVVVATPDAAHAADLARLVTGERPPRLIVMEKPLCVSSEELAAIEASLERHPDTTVVVNHPRRFDPAHCDVRDLISARQFGPVVGVHWAYYGGWLHVGVHLVDTLRMLLGDEIHAVAARPGCADLPGDPCLDVDFRCAAWPQARILVESHPQSAFQLFEGEIRMQEGRVRFLDFGSQILLDSVRVNAIGERELKDTRALNRDSMPTAMNVLYELAARFLMQEDDEIVARASVAEASATMRTLFDARALSTARVPDELSEKAASKRRSPLGANH